MKLNNLVNELMLLGAIAGVGSLEQKATADQIHTKPGAQVVYTERFTNGIPYIEFYGWDITTNGIVSNGHVGHIAAYNAFASGLENIELQLRIKLGFTQNVQYRFEMAMYQITVGSYFSALDSIDPNFLNGTQTTDNPPVWESHCNGIPFNNDEWHDLSFVKNGLLIETYLDNQVVGRATADRDYPVDSFNLSFTDWYLNPTNTPSIAIKEFNIWTRETPTGPRINITPSGNLSWSTNSGGFQLFSSPTVNGEYSLVDATPQVIGTNYSVNVAPTNGQQFFKLIKRE